MQKDLKFKESVAIKKEDKEILDDWGKRVNNMTVPIVSSKGKRLSFVTMMCEQFHQMVLY